MSKTNEFGNPKYVVVESRWTLDDCWVGENENLLEGLLPHEWIEDLAKANGISYKETKEQIVKEFEHDAIFVTDIYPEHMICEGVKENASGWFAHYTEDGFVKGVGKYASLEEAIEDLLDEDAEPQVG